VCVAVPGRLERVFEEDGARLGDVRFGDAVRRVDLVLVPEAVPGDDLIVHSGIAVRRLDPGEAEATLRLLEAAFTTQVDG
jgi:hydrogenase expression/formation protein HypC